MSADKKSRFKSLALQLCALGISVVVIGLAYLTFTPKSYRAVSKVELLKSAWNNVNEPAASFGPEKLPGECQLVRSDKLLDQTIANLNLAAAWAAKYSLNPDQCRQRLRTLLDVHPAPGAIVIEITASGNDPVELAQIVNELARLYSTFRQANREEASHKGIQSLRSKWEEQNQKVQAAQAALDKIADDINHQRATNSAVVLVQDVNDIQSRLDALETTCNNLSNRLAALKGLTRDDLKRVLATNGMDSNSILRNATLQLDKAKKSLAETGAAHGPDATETKDAAQFVSRLQRNVDGLAVSLVTSAEIELSSLQAAIDHLKDMAQKASHATNDLARKKSQDEAYEKAKKDLDALVEQRDLLEREIVATGSMSAAMPGVITARIVSLADPPVAPSSPSKKIALGAFIGGGTLAAAGVLLLVLLSIKPRGAEKKVA